MNFGGLDLNLIVALDALLSERNVSLAATRLGISQPGMSAALRRLRDFFKDELLVQSGRGMVLTPRGASLAGPVREALTFVKNSIALPLVFDPATSDRTFHIIASDHAIREILGGALCRIANRAPRMKFEINYPTDRFQELFNSGGHDLLFMPDIYISDEHPSLPVLEDDFVIVAWSENTLLGDKIFIDDYATLGHVSTQWGKGITLDDQFVRATGRSRRVEIVTPSFSDVPNFVVGTNRIATMHRTLANWFSTMMPLKLLPVPFDLPPVRLMLQWHRQAADDSALAWIIEQIISKNN